MISRTLRRSIFTTSNRLNLSHCEKSGGNKEEINISVKRPSIQDLLDYSTSFVDTKPLYDEDKWATLPYAEGTIMTTKEQRDLDIERLKIDPRDTSLILFPGQGAEFVGMAKSLEKVPAAKDVFDYASEILK